MVYQSCHLISKHKQCYHFLILGVFMDAFFTYFTCIRYFRHTIFFSIPLQDKQGQMEKRQNGRKKHGSGVCACLLVKLSVKKIPEGQINLISPVGILYPHTFSHP